MMLTPSEHLVAATDLLARHERTAGGDALVTARMHAHAALSRAIGTGADYATADALLGSVAARPPTPVDPSALAAAERALSHALMADR